MEKINAKIVEVRELIGSKMGLTYNKLDVSRILEESFMNARIGSRNFNIMRINTKNIIKKKLVSWEK